MRSPSRRSLGFSSTILGVAALGVALLSTPAGAEPDVTPIPVDDTSAFTCAELGGAEPNPPDFSGGQIWLEVKFDDQPLVDDSKGGVTIDMVDGQTFNWSSTIGIDAVFVKGGHGSQIYVYAPTAASAESFGDDGLRLATDQGISYIAFCHDVENPPEETTTTTTETPTTETPTTPTTAQVLNTTIVREAATTTTAADVLGVQQSRELARTGRSSAPLGYLGLGLIGTGLVLLGQHRRTRVF